MSNENGKTAMLITLVTVVVQSGLYLVSGGFAAGGKLTQIESEIKLIRQEAVAANQIQDFRLGKLESVTK